MMIKKSIKIILLVFLSTASVITAYKLSFNIAEKYFFDELFYKKSPIYGYTESRYPNFKPSEKIIEERVKDLRLVTETNLDNVKNILGDVSPSEFKIIIIGDSNVFGQGIKNTERFAIKLESLLNKNRPTRVYSLALPGDNFLEYLNNYLLAKEKIKPDLFIVAFVDNDLVIRKRIPQPFAEAYFQNFIAICGDKIIYRGTARDPLSWDSQLIDEILPSVSADNSNVCILKEALSLMDTSNIIFFPMNPLPTEKVKFPKQFTNPDQEKWLKHSSLMYEYASTLKDAGGYVVNFDYSKVPADKLKVSEMEGHLSPYVNTLIAQTLYTEITTNPRWRY